MFKLIGVLILLFCVSSMAENKDWSYGKFGIHCTSNAPFSEAVDEMNSDLAQFEDNKEAVVEVLGSNGQRTHRKIAAPFKVSAPGVFGTYVNGINDKVCVTISKD